MLSTEKTPQMFYYNTEKTSCSLDFAAQFSSLLSKYHANQKQIVLLCIGSDRSTGDSLGPLIGYKLKRSTLSGITVFGTLEQPVHAANLENTLALIETSLTDPFIIAIDASLGRRDHVGYITLGEGSLRPGLGVNKDLPPVGALHITGIVNFSGMLDSLLLQTTRLCTVMTLADCITRGILYSLYSKNFRSF